MMERRMECGAVIMNGCIYVTGGYSYSKGTYLQSIEKYDPDLNKWEIVGNLPSAMRSHGCVCVYIFFFRLFFIIVYYKILNIASCTI